MLGTFIPDFSVNGITADGRAFGMYGDMKVFVEKGVPGDVADIAMVKSWRDNKTTGNGRIIALKKKSPLRIEPFCRHFQYCGGCQWQNIGYEDQLRFKQWQAAPLPPEGAVKNGPDGIYIESSFPPLGGGGALPIIPSLKQKHFRNRVTFTFSNRRWMSPEELDNPEVLKRPAGGFALKGKNDRVMNIEECYLTDDFAVRLMYAVRDETLSRGFSFYDARHETGFLRGLTVRFGDNNDVMAIAVFAEEDEQKISEILNYLKENYPQITSLYYVIHKKKRGVLLDKPHIHFFGSTFIEYRMENLIFRIGPNSFYQTNSEQAFQLYKVAREFAELAGEEIVYDLYCGTGTISLFVSQQAKKVIGIDNTPEAIADAKTNAELNKISNSTFLTGDISTTIGEELYNQYGRPDVIITDPPRAGMNRDVVRKLVESGAKRIVYISCNPVTQARDIRQLSEKYSLIKSQPVDMFPQTSHVENVAVLFKV